MEGVEEVNAQKNSRNDRA